jgi:hypothetical protein
VAEHLADAYVVDQLLAYLARAELEPIESGQDPAKLRESIEADVAALADLVRARYVTHMIKTDAEYITVRDEVQNRLEASTAALSALENASSLRPGSPDELALWWAAASIGERRTAIRDAFRHITIHGTDKRGGVFDTDRVELRWRVFSGTGRRIMEKVNAEGWEPTEADLAAYAEAQAEAEESERAGTSRTYARFRKGADGKAERIA